MALSFFACSEENLEVFQPQQYADDVSYSINFSLQLQEPVTRSVVYGEDGTDENGVQTMQLLCFDASGLYLGIRDAQIGATGFEGKITGSVPQGTARIHFVANRRLSPALDFPAGTPESEVMQSDALSTKYDFPAIIYWGYKKFDTAEAMNNWLQGKNVTPENKIVYMIRDRAKIKLSLNSDKTEIIKGFTVTNVTWRIHNGHESGYIAPKSEEWGNYTRTNTAGHTQEDQQKIVSNASCNSNNSDRYTIINDEELFESAATPQYLFDDNNIKDDQMKQVVKVIMKVEYKDENDVEQQPKFFVSLVKAPDETYIPIIRNYTYQLTIASLDMDLSYETLADAINGNKYANGDVEVSRNLTDINNDDNSLQIKLPSETTSIVFNMATGTTQTGEPETNKQMQFVIIKNSDLSDAGVDPSKVKVYWEGGISTGTTKGITNYIHLQDTPVTKSSGVFTIPVTVSDPPATLQNDWLVVEYTDNQNRTLKRYIHVFVINQFKFKTYPALKEVKDNDVVIGYKLSFTIPPLSVQNVEDPMYPEGLYPIDVMFATSTLKAWSTNGSDDAYGSFGITVESTSNFTDKVTGRSYNLFDNSGFESGYVRTSTNAAAQNTNWWYQPYNTSTNKGAWDYWYTYSVKEYPTNGEVNIYFKDVKDQLKYATVGNVGLYLYVRYFGKIYGMNVTTN